MVTVPGSLENIPPTAVTVLPINCSFLLDASAYQTSGFPKDPFNRGLPEKDYWMAPPMTVFYCSVTEKLVSQDSKIVYGQLTHFVNNVLLSMQRKKKKIQH